MNQDKRIGVELIDIKNSMPDVWANVNETPLYQQWLDLYNHGMNENNLADYLKDLSFDEVSAHIIKTGELSWVNDKKIKSCFFVEKQNTFHMDYYYVFCFYTFISIEKRMPTESEFWEIWKSLNKISLDLNLIASEEKTCAWFIKQDFECKNIVVSDNAISKMILSGAEYRCKKSYAALIRELYTMVCIKEQNSFDFCKKKFDNCIVSYHPVIDCAAKCDMIITLNDKKIYIAVYLYTALSHMHIVDHKKNHVLNEHIFQIKVKLSPYDGIHNGIYVPSERQIFQIKMALDGDPDAISQISR